MIQSNTFRNYLTVLLKEKGISLEHTFEIPSDSIWGNHLVPMEVVIEFIESLDKPTQSKIKETLVMIDFKNGNVLHYMEYITKGMVQLKFS
jgi:hypothetical protein